MIEFWCITETKTNYIGVASSLEGVMYIFANADPAMVQLVLCVDVPRCMYVSSVYEAQQFFKNQQLEGGS
jgi:hypothetical protein